MDDFFVKDKIHVRYCLKELVKLGNSPSFTYKMNKKVVVLIAILISKQRSERFKASINLIFAL